MLHKLLYNAIIPSIAGELRFCFGKIAGSAFAIACVGGK